jgi:hypothetical protein
MLFACTFCVPLYVYYQLRSHNVQNMVHTIILYYLLLSAVHMMQGFVYEKML